MPSIIKKLSEWLRKRPEPGGSQSEDNPLEILQKRFFHWINTRLGWRWGAALLAVFALWAGWDTVKKLPGVASALTWVAELRPVPRAQEDKFSILIAKLENDEGGVHRRLIDDALRGRFDKEIEVLLPDRSIAIRDTDKPQEAVKAGHERARALLQEANANVMIWGEALDTKTNAPLRLHWTVNAQADLRKSSDKYRPADTNYDLPDLFWADLSDVLSLLATSQAAALSSQRGSYVANQLEPFIKRMRVLVDSGKLTSQQQGNLRMILANGLLSYGEQRGDGVALQEAVSAYRMVLKEYTRERAPLDWATTQNNLGVALRTLGERESGTVRLEEAVSALREALKERTRERAPLDWAASQTNLGGALTRLGGRESGPARLEEAVTAYREALKEFTRERAPLDWATTQNNLGVALRMLGERESGTVRLEEAVSALREALKERTRERAPLDWAASQTNLGGALTRLGGRESGPARLEEAVTAYREALKEYTRERAPLDWATTQNNLGVALEMLGERESGTVRLEEAASAYREALKEYTRERVPLDWAMTQNNLGNALRVIGERESSTARLEEAVIALREALQEYTRERAPYQHAVAKQQLERAEQALAQRKRL